MTDLSDVLETAEVTKVAGGFVFTEGPVWHPDDFYYFVDVRSSVLYRAVLGHTPTEVRKTTGGQWNDLRPARSPDQL
jgi:gluconolactonase